MSTEIKPCPFCAGECNPKIIKTVWFMECLNHGCVYFSGGNLDKSKAIEAHNQLAALPEENERLKKKLNKASRFIEFCKAWSWIPENPREGE